MKKLFSLLCLFGFILITNAQNFVSTKAENKKVLLEEFTGTGCPNCPGGHTEAASLLASYPGTLFVVAYHPSNSSYTSSDPMVNSYPDAFYSTPFIGTTRFMPSAMISRRIWTGTEKIQSVSDWGSDVIAIKNESSPLNLGVSSSYNSSTKLLSVHVQVYFTANVSDNLTVYAELTENGIIAAQSGGSSPYTHNHVFRESFVGQWGDNMATPFTTGTLKDYVYSFDNSTKNYDMTKSEIVVFVRNTTNGEIISVNGADIGKSSAAVNDNLYLQKSQVSVFPNPYNKNTKINLEIIKPVNVEYTVYNLTGQKLFYKDLGMLSPGNHSFSIFQSALSNKGIYFIKVQTGANSYTEKIIVQ
jgi:hypothetical protein